MASLPQYQGQNDRYSACFILPWPRNEQVFFEKENLPDVPFLEQALATENPRSTKDPGESFSATSR